MAAAANGLLLQSIVTNKLVEVEFGRGRRVDNPVRRLAEDGQG